MYTHNRTTSTRCGRTGVNNYQKHYDASAGSTVTDTNVALANC